MTRKAEIVGLVRPEVDESQLDREADKVGRSLGDAVDEGITGFDTRKIQRKLESAIPGGGVLGTAVDAVAAGDGGGGGGGGGTGGSGRSNALGQRVSQVVDGTGELIEQNDWRNLLLEDILDELETGQGGDDDGFRLPGLGSVLGALGGALAGLGLTLGLPKNIPKLKLPDIPPLQIPEIPKLGLPKIPALKLPEIPTLKLPEMPTISVDAPSSIPVKLPNLPLGKIALGGGILGAGGIISKILSGGGSGSGTGTGGSNITPPAFGPLIADRLFSPDGIKKFIENMGGGGGTSPTGTMAMTGILQQLFTTQPSFTTTSGQQTGAQARHERFSNTGGGGGGGGNNDPLRVSVTVNNTTEVSGLDEIDRAMDRLKQDIKSETKQEVERALSGATRL